MRTLYLAATLVLFAGLWLPLGAQGFETQEGCCNGMLAFRGEHDNETVQQIQSFYHPKEGKRYYYIMSYIYDSNGNPHGKLVMVNEDGQMIWRNRMLRSGYYNTMKVRRSGDVVVTGLELGSYSQFTNHKNTHFRAGAGNLVFSFEYRQYDGAMINRSPHFSGDFPLDPVKVLWIKDTRFVVANKKYTKGKLSYERPVIIPLNIYLKQSGETTVRKADYSRLDSTFLDLNKAASLPRPDNDILTVKAVPQPYEVNLHNLRNDYSLSAADAMVENGRIVLLMNETINGVTKGVVAIFDPASSTISTAIRNKSKSLYRNLSTVTDNYKRTFYRIVSETYFEDRSGTPVLPTTIYDVNPSSLLFTNQRSFAYPLATSYLADSYDHRVILQTEDNVSSIFNHTTLSGSQTIGVINISRSDEASMYNVAAMSDYVVESLMFSNTNLLRFGRQINQFSCSDERTIDVVRSNSTNERVKAYLRPEIIKYTSMIHRRSGYIRTTYTCLVPDLSFRELELCPEAPPIIAPNQFSIDLSSCTLEPGGQYIVEVKNAAGATVDAQWISIENNIVQIDLSGTNTPPGRYFVCISDGLGNSQTIPIEIRA